MAFVRGRFGFLMQVRVFNSKWRFYTCLREQKLVNINQKRVHPNTRESFIQEMTKVTEDPDETRVGEAQDSASADHNSRLELYH